jgi:hypothetical protein
MIKVCIKCNLEKPKTEFYKDKRSKDGLKSRCGSCCKEATKNWRKRNTQHLKEFDKKANLKKYNISQDEWDNLFVRQNGKCAICYTASPGGKHGTFHIDHDHTTGAVRGLLCSTCNTGIGMLQDSIDVLNSAVSYLKRFKCE